MPWTVVGPEPQPSAAPPTAAPPTPAPSAPGASTLPSGWYPVSTPTPKAGTSPSRQDETSSNQADPPTRKGSLSRQELKRLWIEEGGPPSKADIMSWVMLNESTGDPTQVNKIGATGLAQILVSAHPDLAAKYNLLDARQNVAAAVALYKEVGLSPWDSSKYAGAYGGWGKHLNDKPSTDIAQTPAPEVVHEDRRYPGFLDDPAPSPSPTSSSLADKIDQEIQKQLDSSGGGGLAPVGPDLQDHRTPVSRLQAFFNAMDVPFYLADALVRNGKVYTNFPEAKYVWNQLLHGKVNEVAEHYNLMSPDQLQDQAKHGDFIAGYMLTYPIAAGVGQGVAESANPLSGGLGWGVSGIGGAALKIAYRSPELRAILNMFSPLAKIAESGGAQGKAIIAALQTRVANAPAEAQRKAIEIFAGLSNLEKEAVVHLQESPNIPLSAIDKFKHLTADRIGEINKRTVLLGEYITDMMKRRAAAGLSDQGEEHELRLAQITGKPVRTFPKGGAEADHLGDVPGSGVGHGFKKPAGESDETLEQMSRRTLIDPKWDPATALTKWYSSGLRRLALNDSLEKLPKNLLQERPANFRGPVTTANIGKLPKDGAGQPMLPFEEIVKKFPELSNIDAPILKKSLISPALAKYLSDRSTLLFDDKSLYLPETTFINKRLNNILYAWDHLSEWNRRAIIANPLIHPVFNLSNNALAAGLPGWEVATLVTKSIVATMIGPQNLEKFLKPSAEWTRWVEEAIADGSVAELKQGDTRLLTTKFSDLNTFAEKAHKMFEEIGAWNARSTFGKYGEEAFSAALRRRLIQSGRYSPEEVPQLVREALGNYQNVTKGEDQYINRIIFFYPWLKGNMPFWVRKFTTAPRYVGAYEQSARANNLLVDDPSERGGPHPNPAKDFVWIFKNSDGSHFRVEPTLPQNMLTDVSTLLTGDLNTMFKKAFEVVESRMRPGLAALVVKPVVTSLQGAESPLDPRDYNTMWSRNAPAAVQWKEFASNVAGEMAFIPLVKSIVQQGLNRGITTDEMKEKLAGGALGAFVYNSLSYNQSYQLSAAMDYWTRQVRSIPKNASVDEKQKRLYHYYNLYANKVRNILYHSGKKPVQFWPKTDETQDKEKGQ